ncbi:MAG: Rid family detoxifying hydrolase [Burkholderiales bacterium]|jgi:2-iminobutanoate/2-iminopropanoate deaminase|tara:strand:+ start:506 stop:886 length:381 start_codon:yes stop_codon:yes gene_type:complete
MANQTIQSKLAPTALGAYSQGIQAGETVYVSGQLGLSANSSVLPSTFSEQAHQAFLNIESILKEVGLTRTNIVKFTVFVSDLNDFSELNKIMASLFMSGALPARSVIQASRLPKDALIEIDAIAVH